MITCKQVSKALAENRIHELPWHKRLGLKLHIKLCFVCGKANTQIVQLQNGIKKMLDREDDDLYVSVRLSDKAKENLKQKMNANNE
tara:strand:+ start:6059 stop:6316 length:258 start_codon:yes stop_codon:yes gene_type:complete